MSTRLIYSVTKDIDDPVPGRLLNPGAGREISYGMGSEVLGR